MSDKKKKKLVKQKQKQSQQVIVNIGSGRARRREPRREVRENKLIAPMQPPPVVQYVYRDNLALNAINERMRENALTQTLMKTAQQIAAAQQQQQPQPAAYQPPKLATPSPALYNQPAPPKSAPPPNVLRKLPDARDVIINNNIYNSTKVPEESKNKIARPEAFEKALNKQMDALEELDNQRQQRQEPSPALPEATGVRLNRNGQPDRRTREGSMLYNQMQQEKQGEPAANLLPPPPPYSRQISSSKVNPIDNDALDEDNNIEENMFFSPLKKKPT